jgi:lipoprotein-anchoring transpeptidase ErfK/SrfK
MPRLTPRRRAAGALVSILALATVVAGCGGSGGEATLGKRVEPRTAPTVTTAPITTTTTTTAPPPAWQSQVAQAKVANVQVYDAPNGAQPFLELPNPWVYDPEHPDQTIPQVFLVKERTPDGWLKVLLPVRPNGSTGWIRAADMTVTNNPYRISVSLDAHTITVTKAEEVVYQGPIAVGKAETPTPQGEFYLRILIQSIDPTSVYGPFAYGLSSHSETLETFAGGDAQTGIHGNNDASVLGSNVTNGCIRIDNDAITMLSSMLPLGTPVEVGA